MSLHPVKTYLVNYLFVLSSSCPGRRALRSASRGDFWIQHSYMATKQNRAFSTAASLSGMAFFSNCGISHVICPARFMVY